MTKPIFYLQNDPYSEFLKVFGRLPYVRKRS